MNATMETTPLLEARDISKSFPGVRALRRVKLEVQSGEVHAVLGENGAGKSTLMHILAGVFPPDEGSLLFHGKRVSFPSPQAAREAGVAIVFQERSLAGSMSVAENIFFGRQPANRWGIIDGRRMREGALAILRELDIRLNPWSMVENLSPADQQMVEIAKALSLDARLLVLDEPTSTLTEVETSTLFRVIARLRERGAGIIYISHRLAEVFRICDRITVLRDGEYQGTFLAAEISEEQLISRMVGREFRFPAAAPASPYWASTPGLEVQELSDDCLLKQISFQARTGEITAVAGLAGSGRTELAMAIFGGRPVSTGRIFVKGRPVHVRSPGDAIRAGIGYLPEDRKDAGLFLEMGLAANFGAASLERFGCWWMDDCTMAEQAADTAARLRLTHTRGRAVQELSGGNQQKVMLARWLLVHPPIFIVDEPTRGIDISSKMEVHQLLRRLAREGTAVVLISSELPEVLALADRILVMREGRLVGDIPPAGATEEKILRLAAISHRTMTDAGA